MTNRVVITWEGRISRGIMQVIAGDLKHRLASYFGIRFGVNIQCSQTPDVEPIGDVAKVLSEEIEAQ
jgi:hypothetical protein